MKKSNLSKFLFSLVLVTPLWADVPTPTADPKAKIEARVPMFRQFVRTLDMEGGAGVGGRADTGVQFFRVEARYLDPDVNAARAGRPDPPRQHAMQVWCGLADSKEAARARLAPAMEAFYQLPFERFEKYCPYGTADDVAEFLAPYVAAGCTAFNLIPQSPHEEQAIAGVAAVKRLLTAP